MPCLKTSLESDAPMARGEMQAIRAPQSCSSILLSMFSVELDEIGGWARTVAETTEKRKEKGGRREGEKKEGKGFWSTVVGG